ncbi:hypothetical protein M9H77_19558 [Catharanthus roseus]|uniref:Uncharacterized protein n=1 Tax=Catharanthus roseus TaxID=4058 RepID=A0ACC0BAM9_CATRO|nr:hypothetical protein M9H77_19558 [Catharanthus roseus]
MFPYVIDGWASFLMVRRSHEMRSPSFVYHFIYAGFFVLSSIKALGFHHFYHDDERTSKLGHKGTNYVENFNGIESNPYYTIMVSNTKIKLDIVMASPEFRKDDGMYELINQSKTIKNAGACEWITQFNHVGQGGQQIKKSNFYWTKNTTPINAFSIVGITGKFQPQNNASRCVHAAFGHNDGGTTVQTDNGNGSVPFQARSVDDYGIQGCSKNEGTITIPTVPNDLESTYLSGTYFNLYRGFTQAQSFMAPLYVSILTSIYTNTGEQALELGGATQLGQQLSKLGSIASPWSSPAADRTLEQGGQTGAPKSALTVAEVEEDHTEVEGGKSQDWPWTCCFFSGEPWLDNGCTWFIFSDNDWIARRCNWFIFSIHHD